MDEVSSVKTDLATAFATALMEQAEDRYAYSKNPIHLWQMYLLARQTGWPIPGPVLTYLDAVAKALTAPNAPNSLP